MLSLVDSCLNLSWESPLKNLLGLVTTLLMSSSKGQAAHTQRSPTTIKPLLWPLMNLSCRLHCCASPWLASVIFLFCNFWVACLSLASCIGQATITYLMGSGFELFSWAGIQLLSAFPSENLLCSNIMFDENWMSEFFVSYYTWNSWVWSLFFVHNGRGIHSSCALQSQ